MRNALTRSTRDISPHAELNEANIDTAIADDAVPTRRTPSSRHAKARPPEFMPADISLRDLKSWRRAWNDFVEIEQLNRFPLTQQRAMLRTSLSVEMRSVLHLAIGIENDDDISVSEILDQMHEYVRAKRNVTLDRVATLRMVNHATTCVPKYGQISHARRRVPFCYWLSHLGQSCTLT